MAAGKASDFVIYEDQMRGGIIETLTQASNYFNQAGGVLRMSTISRRGQFHQESFLANIANAVTRRDLTSVSDATILAQTMAEIISVKLARKYGPVDQTLDAFRKVEMQAGPEALSYLIGTQVAKGMEIDMLDSACRAGVTCLKNAAAVYYDGTGGTMTASRLTYGLAKFGDNAGKIKAFIMHSKPYFDLIQAQMVPAANGEGAANAVVYGGSPATLGRPVIVTDSAALLVDDSPDLYYTLALTESGLVVENSEEELMVTELVTGKENILARLQGEWSYNLGAKGFKYDTTKGANPTNALVATASSWVATASSHKDYAGVCIATR